MTGLTILFEKILSNKNVDISEKKDLSGFVEIAKKHLLNDPKDLLDNLLHFDKLSVTDN